MTINSARWEHLLLWFFPRRCVWCGGVTAPQDMLCEDCGVHADQLEPPGILEGDNIPLVSCFPYHSKAGGIMLNLKFYGARNMAGSIGYTMADALAASHLADKQGWLFCCIPMTRAAMKRRGYNQSELIAKAAAQWSNADFAPDLLMKICETKQQHGLRKSDRLTNIKNAFQAKRPERINGTAMVLCDDICTTGATLRDAARALREVGAAEIICLTYLRTDYAKLEKEELS